MFYSYAIHSDQYIIIVWQVLYQQFPFDIWPLLQLVAWFKGYTLKLLLILQWLGFTENHLPMEKVSKKQPQLLVFMFLYNCQIKSLSRDCCLRSVPHSTSCRNMTARRESEKLRLDLGRLLYLLVRTTTVTCSKHVAFLPNHQRIIIERPKPVHEGVIPTDLQLNGSSCLPRVLLSGQPRIPLLRKSCLSLYRKHRN